MNVDEIPPRREYKYLVPTRVADAFRERMRPFAALDEHSARSADLRYPITSLYYDTPGLSLFADSDVGVRTRFKLRVRSYGAGSGPLFFEVKHRIGEIVIKSRAAVPRLDWRRRLDEDAAADAAPAEVDFRSRVHAIGARPTLLVRYDREAWKGGIDRYVRVTFDTRLEFARVDDDAPLEPAELWQPADDPVAFDESEALTLIEVKFEETVPVWLASAIRDLGMLRRGFSKYGTGIRRTFGAEGLIDVVRRTPTGH